MANDKDGFSETIRQQVDSCYRVMATCRVEMDLTKRLEHLNTLLALVAPRVAVIGASHYNALELQLIRCISITLSEIEQQKAGE